MNRPSHPEPIIRAAELGELCAALAKLGRFAFDTEFVAEDSRRPHVCLIQVAHDNAVSLIDALGELDTAVFWQLVADPAVEKIVHAGAEDLALCWHAIGQPAANIFDLQIAAGFAGMDYPLSLANLVRMCAGARLHKSQTLTDWRRRPLDPVQLDYAVEDVVHLPAIHASLVKKLDALGRRGWCREECDALCEPPIITDVEQKLRRLKGAGSLSPRELAIADALLDERERLSEEYDRPLRAVLKDHLLVELARRGWTDIRKMRTLRGLGLRDSALQRLADAINRARQLPNDKLPVLNNDEDSPDEVMLTALLTAILRDFSSKSGIAFGLLANKQAIKAIVRKYTRPTQERETREGEAPAEPLGQSRRVLTPVHVGEAPLEPHANPGPLATGWRQQALGDLLDRILTGDASVRVVRAASAHQLSAE